MHYYSYEITSFENASLLMSSLQISILYAHPHINSQSKMHHFQSFHVFNIGLFDPNH